MTMMQMAWRNVRHQARNYAAYFLSSTFAVWMFFLYGSMLLHPRIQFEAMPEMIREILLFVEAVVAAFSLFFILYAHSAFLKARTREIATLTLLGARPRQVAGMVRWENLIIGLGATTAGVGLGLAFLKLFLLAMSRVLRLDQPVPFAISWAAIGWTYTAFLLIFLAITLLGQRRLRRISVAEVFREAVRSKEPPAFAWWKVALCVAALGNAYGITLTANGANIGDRVLYVLILLMIGTYLLLSQGSVALLRELQRWPGLYTRRTNLLTISQLIFKLRENARILFMVATLSTISLIAIGLFYSAWMVSAQKAEEFWPVGLRVYGEPGGVTPQRVEQTLQEQGVEVRAAASVPVIRRTTILTAGGTHQGPPVMPLSAVNAWITSLGREPLTLAPGGGIVLTGGARSWPAGETAGLSLERLGPPGSGNWKRPEPLFQFRLERVEPMPPLNEQEVLLLDDALFQQVARAREPVLSHLWMLKDWRASLPAAQQLYAEANATRDPEYGILGPLVATALANEEFQRTNGLGFFLAAFIAALFFLASGNMLYFKLFTDLYDDRLQFRALDKIGILPGEVQRVVSTQTLVLFFVPLALAVLNATVALHLFTSIFAIALWEPLAVTAGGYTLLYLAYFLATRRTYVRALLNPDR